jgi:hypothetical protein
MAPTNPDPEYWLNQIWLFYLISLISKFFLLDYVGLTDLLVTSLIMVFLIVYDKHWNLGEKCSVSRRKMYFVCNNTFQYCSLCPL